MKQGLPAVVIVTEHFDKLARVIIRSQHAPESIAITIKGKDPETITEDELTTVIAEVIEQVVERLTAARKT